MISDLQVMFLTEETIDKFVAITGRDYSDLLSEMHSAEAHNKQVMMTIELHKVRKI